jgi:hypothetical protein
MERSSRRVVDDDRLAGLWVRHVSPGEVFYAPVRLPDGGTGLVQADCSRRTVHWLLFDRRGQRDGGEFDVPAVAIWQALAHLERLLGERGVQLDAGAVEKG